MTLLVIGDASNEGIFEFKRHSGGLKDFDGFGGHFRSDSIARENGDLKRHRPDYGRPKGCCG